jgi:hypothetical protein
MSVSAPVLDLAWIQRLRTGAQVEMYDPARGRSVRWTLLDSMASGWRWQSQNGDLAKDGSMVGAYLMSDGNGFGGGYGGGSAGMTQSMWIPAPAPSPSKPKRRTQPAATQSIVRALVPGMRAPTTEEAALLPEGSIIYSGDGYGYEKNADGSWVDHDGEEFDSWNGCDSEVILRVGDGTQTGAYLAPSCSPDELIALLLDRGDLRAALADRVPALRDLADAIGELARRRAPVNFSPAADAVLDWHATNHERVIHPPDRCPHGSMLAVGFNCPECG